ncbi:hypothetical protein NDU88_004526 [Pleurodeles waltl]|uniref:Uncharacterized protein n=1 Tax=Pleurodeles waltl TaxID=8319 RepID=A0AAV7W587_PLEWA|nr:hypothetical protein NDU88_004526 [Pleurodeles waltl]
MSYRADRSKRIKIADWPRSTIIRKSYKVKQCCLCPMSRSKAKLFLFKKIMLFQKVRELFASMSLQKFDGKANRDIGRCAAIEEEDGVETKARAGGRRNPGDRGAVCPNRGQEECEEPDGSCPDQGQKKNQTPGSRIHREAESISPPRFWRSVASPGA